MSTLIVSRIATESNTTYLTLATANTLAGSIVIQTSNSDITIANGVLNGDGGKLFNVQCNVANAAYAVANSKVDTITSNSTSRIWANSVVTSNVETVYLDLAVSGVTATTYGGSTAIPVLVVDAYGRVTSASNTSIVTGTTITNDTVTNATYYPMLTTATSGTITVANTSNTGLSYNPSTGTLSATDFNTTSDISLKENINEINSDELIDLINPVEFTWKKTGNKSYGVIAQEFEHVLPELVTTGENGIKSVSYIPLISILVDIVKKQRKEINEIKTLLNKQQ